jgi:hypothetical protein
VKNDTCKTTRFRGGYFFSARVFATAVTLAASATVCLAAGTEAQRQACTPDVFRLCSSSIPSVDRIVACLKTNRAKLSPACSAVFGTQTAAATRSIAPQEEVDFCAFTPGQTDATKTNWQSWCGAKAH